MPSFHIPGLSFLHADTKGSVIDQGTLCRSTSPAPGTLDPVLAKTNYAYSISGTTGVFGSMLFTEAMRIEGTWYDRTDKATALRMKESELGKSRYADKAFQKLAQEIVQNINSPPKVDVDIHFTTKNNVENILVQGGRGTQSFRFDFDAVEADSKLSPDTGDSFKPFLDATNAILAAVVRLR